MAAVDRGWTGPGTDQPIYFGLSRFYCERQCLEPRIHLESTWYIQLPFKMQGYAVFHPTRYTGRIAQCLEPSA